MPRIDHIEILDELGAGGTASVKLGIDLNDGFPVAIKVLHKSLFKNEDIRKKFISEANHYVYLKHKNIVKLKDFIIKDDAYYLVMEYIEGDTIENYINKISGPIPEEVAVPMLNEVLNAIGHAHKNKVVHLDIKPANIMITKDNEIKVLDFGISSDLGKDIKGAIMGSPMYMAPEQTVKGKKVDSRTDIYALGVTFHQMLTANLPYSTNISRKELFETIKTKPLKRVKEFVPWVSDAAQNIIDRATAKKPDSRYSSCREFMEDLNQLL
jgi:eukaryotic-like serine/threonine-protein kinase